MIASFRPTVSPNTKVTAPRATWPRWPSTDPAPFIGAVSLRSGRFSRSCSEWMNLWSHIKTALAREPVPEHLQRGKLGERAAKRHLSRAGLKFLAANFRSRRGEIDLVFRDKDCLVFIEVKTRSSEEWVRPAAAVNKERRQRLTRAALDYLRLLKNPPIKIRFDIVEVLLDTGAVRELR